MVEKASKKGGPKNARALSDLAVLSAYGSDKPLRELPESFQQRFLGTLETPKGLTASKAQERTDKILDTPLGKLISSYGGDDSVIAPADVETRRIRREGLQNLINHPETPEEIRPTLQKQLDLLDKVEPLREQLTEATTKKEKDDLNRAIDQNKTKLQEEIDPRGFGDAYRFFNERTGKLEFGVAGPLEDPRTAKDRGLFDSKTKRTWSLTEPEHITLETLKRHAVNSNQGHLLQDTKDMDVEEARAYLQHQMGLRTSSVKTFESSKRISDPMKSIPSWDSQAELPVSTPVPRSAQIGEPDMSGVQFPLVSEQGMYGPEGMRPDLKRSQLERIDRLDEAIQSGTHLDDPELRQEFADRITHEVIGNIRGEREKSNLISEMDFDRLIQDEMPNERSTINSDLSNLSSDFRQAGGPQNLSDISGDLEEGESVGTSGPRRAENRLSDMQRQALIDQNAKGVESLAQSLRVHNGDDDPSIDVFVQNWMNNNAETLRNAGADTGMIANLITKDYYNHLQANGLIDVPERSPFTSSFGRYNSDLKFNVVSPQKADQITSDTNNAGLLAQSATQAITDLEAGRYQQVLQNSQNTQVLTGLETDARSIKRRIQELEDTLAETTDQNDQVLLNSNLIQLRHELSKTESQTAQLRKGLDLRSSKNSDVQLTFEESLQRARQQNPETRVYLGKGQSADEFVKSVPKAKVSGDSVVTLSSVAMKKAMQKGLVKPGYKAVTKVYSPDEESSNPVDFRHDDGSYNTLVANIHLNNTGEELDESLIAGYNQETDRVSPRIIEEISKIARDEFGLTGLHYNPADNVIEIVRPHGEDRTDWAGRVAEFNATYGRDIARGGGRSDPEVRLETVRLLQDQTAARPRQGLSRTGLRRSGRGTDKPSEPPVSPSVKLARDYAAANPDYNGDHTKWNSSKDFPLKTWSDFDQNDPASDIAFSNYISALDQVKEFENDEHFTYLNTPIERAIESYAQNAADTAKEQGLGKKVAGEAFEYVFALAGINKLLRSRD